MNNKLLFELNNHNVYYIKNDNICYYINVPKKNTNTSICIDIKNKMGNYDMELNDEIWVLENVKNTYSYIDSYDITLAIPVFKEKEISILEKIDNSKFDEIDKKMGFIINNAYLFLTENNISVQPVITLIDNERYKSFMIWFETRYVDRVQTKKLIELIQYYDVNATLYEKVETPGINFVIGTYGTEVDAPKMVKDDYIEENAQPVIKQKTANSYGYASYWILAGITLLVSSIVAIIAYTMK